MSLSPKSKPVLSGIGEGQTEGDLSPRPAPFPPLPAVLKAVRCGESGSCRVSLMSLKAGTALYRAPGKEH